MKALVTGAGGLLGSELSRSIPNAIRCDHAGLDVCDEDSVWKSITRRNVDVVFHCAAMTDVDRCEREPGLARRINALGTRHVAAVCASLGIFLVAVSTDYVLDGKPGHELPEDATPKPLSVYGRTKLEGEIAIEELAPAHAIVRTSWLYGSSRPSFIDLVITSALDERTMGVVTSQTSSPTWVQDLAPAMIALARKKATGIFHLTNEGAATRLDWARAILEYSGLDPDRVHGVDSFPAAARRPRYSALTNTRARRLGITLPDWRQSLRTFIQSDDRIQGLLNSDHQTLASSRIEA